MSTTRDDYPTYMKVTVISVGLIAIFFILSLGKNIVLPLVFAGIFAILLNPLVEWFIARGFNRVLAIIAGLIVGFLLLGVMMYFVGTQLLKFADTFPQLQEKFGILANDTSKWFANLFGIEQAKFSAWLANAREQVWSNSAGGFGKVLGSIGVTTANILLMPIYVFFMIFYRPLLLEFVAQLFPREKHDMVVEVLDESKVVIQSYLRGLLLEMVIIAVLNTTALLLIGVEYAILLGIIGAILNIIPYIGGLITVIMTVLVTLATQSPAAAGLVVVAFTLIQLVDNNIIVPKIVASKVKLNALISIVAVLVGGALFGVPGMFLSIPVVAIMKVIFDRIEQLKPLGFLLGDNMPPIGAKIFHFPRRKKAAVEKEKAVAEKEKVVEKSKASA